MSFVESELLRFFEKEFGAVLEVSGLTHLESVVSCFARVPYENLTKIIRANAKEDPFERLRKPIEVLRDFCRWGTGGTCFSLTNCLQKILSDYGYQCYPRMADLGNRSCNHCALIVEYAERSYLLDPGYLITRPLPIPETGSIVHETRLYPVLLERNTISGGLEMSTLEPSGAKHRYHLHDVNCSSDEFISYWIDSFSWTMMNSLLITRVIPDGRFYLHDRHVRWFNREGHRSKKMVEHFDDEVAVHTGIDRSIVNEARRILAQTKRILLEE